METSVHKHVVVRMVENVLTLMENATAVPVGREKIVPKEHVLMDFGDPRVKILVNAILKIPKCVILGLENAFVKQVGIAKIVRVNVLF